MFNHSIKNSCLTVLFVFSIFSTLCAQNLGEHNWYFGSTKNVIRFNRPNFKATLITRPPVVYGQNGGAVASDPVTGNLLFYTDGDHVYDASNNLMAGSGLGGQTNLNQPAVIAPKPGVANEYYIFTINAISNSLDTAVVKTDAFGNATFPSPALGAVISKGNVPSLTNLSGAMTIIPNANGKDAWLITQSQTSPGNYTYTVSAITATGINAVPTATIAGTTKAANFSYNSALGKVAVSPKDVGKNIEIYNFDPATGALTFDQPIVNTGSGVASASGENIYDVAWSADGKYLYFSRGKDVLQVDLAANLPGAAQPASPVSILPVTVPPLDITESFGLQMGPDSAIYQLYENSKGEFLMAKISDTDSIASKVVYKPEAFKNGNNSIDFKSKQFPSFSPPADITYSVDFDVVGACTNSPVSFYPTVTPAADSLVWDFGDGSATVNSWSPVHKFTNPSSTVTVKAYVNGKVVATNNKVVTLTDFKLQLSVKSDTTACSCELTYPKANPPPTTKCSPFQITAQSSGGTSPTYQWYGPAGIMAGETSTTLSKVDSAGYYYIKATNGGCSVTAGQNVKEYHVADQRANIWYFGHNSGLDFNPLFRVPPSGVKSIPGPIDSPAGVAVICDQNGQVVLSTDGSNAYDRNGNLLQVYDSNGAVEGTAVLGGDPSSTQSSLIIPVQGDQTLYYIFTTQEVGSGSGSYKLSYTLFDLKLGAIGGIVDPDNNPATPPSTELFVKSDERLTGNANWLIAHEFGNNSFRAYKVSTDGLGAPVITGIGSDHLTGLSGKGYMRLGPRNLLAVALSDAGSNSIELFDFIDSTGTVTNYRKIDLNQPTGTVYGVEFSPGGNKLYATLSDGGSSYIYEYGIDSLGVATLIQKSAPIPGKLGAMQIGPDGQIYIAVDGSPTLFHFSPDDNLKNKTDLLLADFQKQTLTGTSSLGLPNFIQTLGNPLQSPSMTVTGNCPNVPVDFAATPSDQYRDDYNWQVLQGGTLITSSTQQNFQYTFTTPGTYQVSLDITSTCSYPSQLVARFTKTLIINAPPPNPTFLIPPDNTNLLCSPTKQLEALPATTPGVSDFGFLWTTTDVTRVITISKSGNYGVTITDNTTGCTSNGAIDIFDNRPIVDLGPDFAMCSNEVHTLDAQNPAIGITYAWQINDVAAPGTNTNQRYNVITTAPFGTKEYKVTVTDGACSAKDSVLVTVNQIPLFTKNILANPTCGATGGEVRLDITSTSGTYTVNFPGDIRSNRSPGQVLPTFQNLPGGTYNFTISNELTGCIVNDVVGLNNLGFSVSVNGTIPASCAPISVLLNRSGGTGNLFYDVIRRSTGQIIASGTDVIGGPTFSTPLLPPDDYIIKVTDATSCVTTLDFKIPSNPLIDFTVTQTCNSLTASPSPPAAPSNYTWTIDGSLSGNTASILTPIAPGPHTVVVTTSDLPHNFCLSSQTISITVDDNAVADFTQSDACKDPVILTATPTSSLYNYTWTENSTVVGGGQKLTALTSGNYVLSVKSKASGCSLNSPQHDIVVNPPVSVTISSTLPCQGYPFTITASPTPANAALSWFYNTSALTADDGKSSIQDTRAGTYKVNASINGCPPVSKTLPITISPVTKGKLPIRAFICDDPLNLNQSTKQITLKPGNNFLTYDWYEVKSGLATSLNVKDSTYTATAPGLYEVHLTNAFGCADTVRTDVLHECDPLIVGPNAFRPGSTNAENADFHLYSFFVAEEDFQVFIFNRWGEMVFQSGERLFTWNGGFNNNAGAPSPPGTYSYVVKYKSLFHPEKGIKEKHGGVLLLR